MRNKRQILTGGAAAFAMLIIVLDTKTALGGARDGITLCVQTVIPSLFPFIVFSGIINSCILGSKLRLLRPLGQLCKIPDGSESLLLIGLIAGYPIGAQLIGESFRQGNLSKETANRMLGFCSNAGPAFLFGMIAQQFSHPVIPLLLWLLHIITAVAVGSVLPSVWNGSCELKNARPLTLVQSLPIALKAMSEICGWVILFRIALAFFDRWFFWRVDSDILVLVSGLLELSNGCVQLKNITSEGLRFVFASLMLAAGGLCVGMQTVSVTNGLGTGWYFPGKVLQSLLAVTLSCFVQPHLFPAGDAFLITPGVFYILLIVTAVYVWYLRKKGLAFLRRLQYNRENK